MNNKNIMSFNLNNGDWLDYSGEDFPIKVIIFSFNCFALLKKNKIIIVKNNNYLIKEYVLYEEK